MTTTTASEKTENADTIVIPGYKEVPFTIAGVVPILLCNSQLCDPLHPIVRQLNDLRGKPTKKRTLDEHQQIADLEWTGGLYLNDKNEPCIPSENVESMLTEAASKVSRKKGDAQAAIIVDGDLLPIDYGPKRSLEEMKRDPKFRLRKA